MPSNWQQNSNNTDPNSNIDYNYFQDLHYEDKQFDSDYVSFKFQIYNSKPEIEMVAQNCLMLIAID